MGGPREPLDRLGFTDLAISHSTEHGVEFVELDLIETYIVEKRGRKGLQLVGGLHQPPEDRVGIEFEDPRGAPDAQPLG